MAFSGDGTSTVPSFLLPYDDKLAGSLILPAVQDSLMLPAHPAILDLTQVWRGLAGVRGMTLAGTVTIPIDDIANVFGSTNEATSVAAATQINPTSASFGVTNYEMVYGSTDELRRRDETGIYDIPLLTQRLIRGWMMTETNILLDLADSMTNIVGAATDPASWDLIREARDEVEDNGENPEGNFLCTLHTNQWALIRADIESRGGAIQMRRNLDEAQMAGMGNYKGTYDNIDFYATSRVNVAAGVYSGMLAAPGALGYARIPQAAPTQSTIVVLSVGNANGEPIILVEEKRGWDDRETKVVGRATYGATVLKQALCARIRSTGRT